MPDVDMQEIIPRPPSHPTTTTLLIASTIGACAAIWIVGLELFGDYLPNAPADDARRTQQIIEGKIHDHYAVDYPRDTSQTSMMEQIRAELKVGPVPGASPGPGASSDGGF